MTLQTSGAISLNDLASEFGGNTPHAINEYYRGGGLVPDTATNSGIPTSGQIDMNDFYGGDVVSGPPAGQLYTWGGNSDFLGKASLGALGNGSPSIVKRSSPAQTVAGGSNWTRAVHADSSQNIMMGVKSDGRLWTWGNGLYGGRYPAIHTSSPAQTQNGGTSWSQSINASAMSGAIQTDGRLWTWGQNNYGNLGRTVAGVDQNTPSQTVAGGTNWATISGNRAAMMGTKTDGRLWTWGYVTMFGIRGQNTHLGNEPVHNQSSAVQTITGGTNWVSDPDTMAQCNNGDVAAARKTDGRLWTWGQNYAGELGDNTSRNMKSSPVQVVGNATTWRSVWCSSVVMTATKTDGRFWCWGRNANEGALTLSDQSAERSSPIQTISGGTNWAEDHHQSYAGVCSLKTDGRYWCWGSNDFGDTGRNVWSDYETSPAQLVGNHTDWTSGGRGAQTVSGIRS